MRRIVFLVSGSGGTLKFLYYAIKRLKLDMEIVGVVGDRKCSALDFAAAEGIYSKQVKYNRNATQELQTELKGLKPDVIVTNIHKILDAETLHCFPEQFINVHYSLLPGFTGIIGMETVAKAKAHNALFVGGTCHSVTEEVDAGKIIQQGCFAVDWSNDATVIDTVFRAACISLLAGIALRSGIRKSDGTDKLVMNDRSVYFSPPIPFIETDFSEELWELVKKS